MPDWVPYAITLPGRAVFRIVPGWIRLQLQLYWIVRKEGLGSVVLFEAPSSPLTLAVLQHDQVVRDATCSEGPKSGARPSRRPCRGSTRSSAIRRPQYPVQGDEHDWHFGPRTSSPTNKPSSSA